MQIKEGNSNRRAVRRGRLAVGLLSLLLVAAFAGRSLAAGADALAELPPLADRTRIAVEALKRLSATPLETNLQVSNALRKVLGEVRGRPEFIELVREFKLESENQALLEFGIKYPDTSAGADAVRGVLDQNGTALIQRALSSTGATAVALARVLGNTSERRVVPLLLPLITNRSETLFRKELVTALAQTREGATALLDLAANDQLPAAGRLTASLALNTVRWPAIKLRASQLLPLPKAQTGTLPPVRELMKRTGDSRRGEEVFRRETVGCHQCHLVNGQGIDFGPQLSEIGTKLGKDALYESILDPNAGISFGFEAYRIELKDGEEAYGLIVSETPEDLSIKTQNGIVTKFAKAQIAKREQQKLSIMPAELQQTMSEQDLVDLVEYLSTLKKATPEVRNPK
jgi:putative heme-binding domain-containing protein